jgi:RNA polymerase sigma-70 factor, ECF subfamily
METEGPVDEPGRGAWDRSDYGGATTEVFAAYGAELYGFLLAQFRGESSHADEVFAAFSEDFWKGLPAFQWRSSIRAWCYKVARSAASRYRRSPHNRPKRQIPLSAQEQLMELAAISRATTLMHHRSEVKDKVRELREQLGQDDQDLLILRVDRGLSWREVAQAMAEDDAAEEDALRKLEVAVRKRFEAVTKRLKVLAENAGLL